MCNFHSARHNSCHLSLRWFISPTISVTITLLTKVGIWFLVVPPLYIYLYYTFVLFSAWTQLLQPTVIISFRLITGCPFHSKLKRIPELVRFADAYMYNNQCLKWWILYSPHETKKGAPDILFRQRETVPAYLMNRCTAGTYGIRPPRKTLGVWRPSSVPHNLHRAVRFLQVAASVINLPLNEMKLIYYRCCGLDIHKDLIVTCILVGRKKEIRSFGTITDEIIKLASWLNENVIQAVSM